MIITQCYHRLRARAAGCTDPNPVVLALEGITDLERTARFADRLLALIEQHSQPRAASVLIGYEAAADGHLPYWRVRVLPSLKEVSRPPVDPDAVSDVELTAEQEAALARIVRDREQRRIA